MPEISRFYGIVITLNFNDHLPPHVHAWYGGYRATVAIEDGAPLHGELPGYAARMVREWATLHRAELMEAWEQTRQGRVPFKIEPLE